MSAYSKMLPDDGCGPKNLYLESAIPCKLASFCHDESHEKKLSTLEVDLHHLNELPSLSEANLPFLLQTAWALVLRCYTGQNDVCFGYEEIQDSEAITMPMARVVLDETKSIQQTIEKTQHDYTTALQSGVLKLPVESFCNTALSFVKYSDSAEGQESKVSRWSSIGSSPKEVSNHLNPTHGSYLTPFIVRLGPSHPRIEDRVERFAPLVEWRYVFGVGLEYRKHLRPCA